MNPKQQTTRTPFTPPSQAAAPVRKQATVKKYLIPSLVVFGILLIAALPYAHGALANRINQEIVAGSNENSESGKAEIIEHKSGYTNSQTTFSWAIDSEHSGLEASSYQAVCDIKHGITGYHQRCKLKHPEYQAWVADKLQGEDPLTLVLNGNLVGKFNSVAELDPFELDDGSGEIFSIGAASIKANLKSLTSKALILEGTAEGLQLKGSEENINVEGVTLSGELASDGGLLSYGFGDVVIDKISVTGTEENMIFEKAGFRYDIPPSDKEFSMTYLMNADAISFDNPDGSTTIISNAGYGAKVGGIDPEIAKEITYTYKQALNSDDDGEAAIRRYLNYNFHRVFIAGANMRLNAYAAIDDKPFNADFAVKLDQPLRTEDLASAMFTPDDFLKKLDVAINFSMAEAFLADMEKMSGYPAGSMAANAPYSVLNGDMRELIATIKDGVFTLNGEVTSVEEIMASAVGVAAGVSDSSSGFPPGVDPAQMGLEDLSDEEMEELLQLMEQIK